MNTIKLIFAVSLLAGTSHTDPFLDHQNLISVFHGTKAMPAVLPVSTSRKELIAQTPPLAVKNESAIPKPGHNTSTTNEGAKTLQKVFFVLGILAGLALIGVGIANGGAAAFFLGVPGTILAGALLMALVNGWYR